MDLALRGPVKRMLVGLDDSPRARQVLAAALAVARSVDAQVHVLRLLRVLPTPDPLGALLGDISAESVETRVTANEHWKEILVEANALEADVLVIAGGEDADQIVIASAKPVLVVREQGSLLHFRGSRPR